MNWTSRREEQMEQELQNVARIMMVNNVSLGKTPFNETDLRSKCG